MRPTYAQDARVDTRPMMVWATVAILACAVVVLIVAAPLAQAYGHNLIALEAYRLFSRVCHQLPERSFYLAGYQLAVCARCTGLYFGIAAAAFFYPLARSLKRTDALPSVWLFVAAAPMAIDHYLDYLGIWHNTHLSRFTTGVLVGAATMFYIIAWLMKLSAPRPRRNRITSKRSRN